MTTIKFPLIFKRFFNFRLVFALICTLFIYSQNSIHAQITSLPHTETFTGNFVLGNNIDFITNWFGNEIDADARIFKTAGNELAMIPTSSFEPEIQVRLNLTPYKNVAVSFNAKSVKNGEGNRSSILFAETSYDGGLTWNTRKQILSFPNENQSFSGYKYILAGAASSKRPVLVRFTVTRSEGEGTAAQIVMDDVSFFEEASDITPPEVISVTASTSRRVQVKYNDKMGSSAFVLSNYQGLPNLSSLTASPDSSTFTLEFSADYGIGKDQILTISNVADKAGNRIAAPYQQKIVYNNLRPEIVISEIMYNTPLTEEDSLEFLEIYNKGSQTAALGGLYFSAGLTMTFPEYQLGPGQYVLLASNARAAKNVYGADFLQWEAGSLNNAGENLEIKNSLGQVVTSVKYERTWGGDGNGRSISNCYPVLEADNNNPLSWSSTNKSLNVFVEGVEIFATPGSGCQNVVPELRFNSYSTYAFEGATMVKLQIVSVNPNGTSSVTLALDESSTAVAGVDFATSVTFPYVVNFPPSTRMVEIEIQVLDDTQQEDIEKAIFKLVNPVNAVIGGRGYFVIDILDNDAAITHVCVNELSASNNSLSGISDEFGNADDWIELKNGGSTPIVLAGYFVTDNPNNLTKHQLSLTDIASVTIPANGYLILWADNETSQGGNHLDFALSASGEYFALVMPDGKTIVDDISFPPLRTNTSYGRTEDCKGAWIVFETPTFKAPNKPTSVIQRENASTIVLYPNPNNGHTIFVSEPIDYILYDQSGKLLKRDKKSQQIDVSNLPNGLYILNTEDGYSTKFIISR